MEENINENLGTEATQDNDRVIRVNIEEQMKTSYIDYVSNCWTCFARCKRWF